jgi:hypothetical protein
LTESISVATAITLDPVTHRVSQGKTFQEKTVTDAQGKRSTTRTEVATAKLSSGQSSGKLRVGGATFAATCVNNKTTPQFRANKPIPVTFDDPNIGGSSYVFHLYSVDRARTAGGKEQFQIEVCFTGGADAYNRRLVEVTAAAAAADTQPHRIGESWGTDSQNGVVSSSLSFNMGVGPISIGGSVPVTVGGEFKGSAGTRNSLLGDVTPPGSPHNIQNQVNSGWNRGNFFDLGATGFKGNVGHGLWEWPQSDLRSHRFWFNSSFTRNGVPG